MSAYNDQPSAQPASSALFEVALALDGDRGTVRLAGELDITSTDQCYAVLATLCHDGYRHVTLQLSELRFLSASGAGVLAHAAADYARAGGSLTVSQPTPMVARVLGLTGLQHLITATSAHLTGTPLTACDLRHRPTPSGAASTETHSANGHSDNGHSPPPLTYG